MRVGVVHDTILVCESLVQIVGSTGKHQIAWKAYSGPQAVERAISDPPDVILMAADMPGSGCVGATRQIMARAPCPIVIVTSSSDEDMRLVFQAMGAGALDVAKGPGVDARLDILGESELLRKLSVAAGLGRMAAKAPQRGGKSAASELLVVGASAGGPLALLALLKRFKPSERQAVVVVQHVDPHFAPRLVEYLASEAGLPVVGAEDGQVIEHGRVYVAVANQHLIIAPDGHLAYIDEPRNVPYRPSIDVFFNSVAAHWQGTACGVLLTGMGKDGAQGLLRLRQQGRYTVAQDEASCVVYGMPRAAKEIGAAVDILSLENIGPAVKHRFESPHGSGYARRFDAN